MDYVKPSSFAAIVLCGIKLPASEGDRQWSLKHGENQSERVCFMCMSGRLEVNADASRGL